MARKKFIHLFLWESVQILEWFLCLIKMKDILDIQTEVSLKDFVSESLFRIRSLKIYC